MSVRGSLGRFAARAWRFSTVGVGNAIIDVGTLNLLLWLFPPAGTLAIVAYNGLALLLANANSYLWNSLWTFRREARGSSQQRVLFAGQALMNAAVNAALFWLAIHILLDYTELPQVIASNLAKVISTVVAFTVSFFLLRHVVFSGKTLAGKTLSRKDDPPEPDGDTEAQERQ